MGLLISQALLGSPAVAASGVEITSGPSGTVASSDASFAFSSSDGASFECSLDGGAYEPCSSPKSYAGLVNGPHFFAVRAQAGDGSVDATPSERQWTVENLKPCTGADEPANFPVYSLGSSVGGLPLTSITRRCDALEAGAPGRANYVSYVYGVCPGIEEGTENICQAPLAIQTWPACERSLADYQLAAGVPYPREKLGKLEGVPAYSFDEGTRVELYTSTATIAIFVTDPALIDPAVAAIQPEPASEPPGESAPADAESANLPPPAPGAITGTLSCA
ncbi:MAG TPA: hypothetical protein VN458_06980 [Solirubrobacterales bacterium]|nr:hypothetical protein [Solirubrobacterales bacterium]